MEAGENPARSRHCKEGVAVQIVPLRNGFVGRQTAVKISESGNMHDTDYGSQASEKRKVEFLFAKNSKNGLWQGC